MYPQFDSISYLLKVQSCCDRRTYLHISDTQQDAKHANEGDSISLHIFFKNKESRLKVA
jgi:hypothetical protein